MKKTTILLLTVCLGAGAAQAQLTQTGAGHGPSGAPPPTYTGPTDTFGNGNLVEFWGLEANQSSYRGSKAIRACDTGDVHCQDFNTDATTGIVANAPSISGASGSCAAISCTIKTFYGQKGVSDETQATEANRAVFVSSCIGSNPCVAGTTVTFYQTTVQIAASTQPLTFYGVGERTGNTGTETIFMVGAGAATYVFDWANGANLMQSYAGVGFTAAQTDNSFHTLQHVINTTSSIIGVDATQTTGDAGANTAFSPQDYYIMGTSGSNGMTGKFFSAGVYNIAGSSGDLTTVNTQAHLRVGY